MRSPRFRNTNSIGSHKILFLLPIIAACFCPTICFGQTMVNDNWLGGTGNWSNPANWSAGVVPNNSGSTVYNVIINSGGTDVVELADDENITIASLVVGGTAGHSTLEYPTGNPYMAYAFVNVTGALTVNKNGKIQNVGQYGGENLVVGGDLTLAGIISATQGGRVDLQNVTISPSGSLFVSGNSGLNAATVTNSGIFSIGSSGRASISGGITQVEGTISVVDPLSTLEVGDGNGMGIISASGGTIQGAGTIIGALNITGKAKVNANVLELDRSGCGKCWYGLLIDNYYPNSQTTLTIEVNTSSNSPSVLSVPGNIGPLSGTLTLSLFKGNIPAVGYSVTALEAESGGITGTFSKVNLPALPNGETWSISYNPSSVVLTVEAPATPSSQ
jgi:hypothetical protein